MDVLSYIIPTTSYSKTLPNISPTIYMQDKISVLFLKNRIVFIVYIDWYKTKFWFLIYSLSYSWHLFKEMTTIMFLQKHCNHLSLKYKVGTLGVTRAKLAAISDWHEFF